jgi:hypothetical protein
LRIREALHAAFPDATRTAVIHALAATVTSVLSPAADRATTWPASRLAR